MKKEVIQSEGAAINLTTRRDHLHPPRTVRMSDAKGHQLGFRKLLVGLDVKQALLVCPHGEISEPGADAAIAVK
jgi:hypothetical protein